MPDPSRGSRPAASVREVLLDASLEVDGIGRLAPVVYGLAIGTAGFGALAVLVALAGRGPGWAAAGVVLAVLGFALTVALARIVLETAWRIRRIGRRLDALEDDLGAVRRRVEDLPDAATVSVEVDAVEAVREAMRQGAAGMDELRRRTGLPGAALRGALRVLGARPGDPHRSDSPEGGR